VEASFLDRRRPELMAGQPLLHAGNAPSIIGEDLRFSRRLLKTATTAEWLTLLEAADIPVSRINSVEDVVSDPHDSERFLRAEEPAAKAGCAQCDAHRPVRFAAGKSPARTAPGAKHSASAARGRYSTRRSRRCAAGSDSAAS